ncbi:MAG TPA: hypothetical protein VD994_03825 [Prosthecobacter sp.]|nr:hypothetical protein [Prosthecobacter sp.]
MLQIADQTFQIASATLVADVTGGALSWSLNIETVAKNVGGKRWQPHAYSDHLLPIEGIMLEHWTDVFLHDLTWSANYHEEAETTHAALDVFKPLDIFDSRLRITPQPGGNQIQIDWSARCDVFFSDAYGGNLPLEIHTPGTFDGIVVGEPGESLTESEALERLRPHVATGDFHFYPAQDPHMLPMMCVA